MADNNEEDRAPETEAETASVESEVPAAPAAPTGTDADGADAAKRERVRAETNAEAAATGKPRRPHRKNGAIPLKPSIRRGFAPQTRTKADDMRYRKPEAKKVLEAAGLGMTQTQIVAMLSVKRPGMTLYHLTRLYQTELNQGEALSIYTAGSKLLHLGVLGNVTALIFFLKARAGWVDNRTIHQGDENKPIPIRLESLTEAQIDHLIERLKAGTAGGPSAGEAAPPKQLH